MQRLLSDPSKDGGDGKVSAGEKPPAQRSLLQYIYIYIYICIYTYMYILAYTYIHIYNNTY